MENSFKNRVWIKAERNLTFNDIREALPNITLEHGLYGVHDNITKVTLYRDLFKQEKISEIFFDEDAGRFLFGEKFNDKISTELGKLYGFYTLTFKFLKALNPMSSFEQMLLSLAGDMENYIKHTSWETNQL